MLRTAAFSRGAPRIEETERGAFGCSLFSIEPPRRRRSRRRSSQAACLLLLLDLFLLASSSPKRDCDHDPSLGHDERDGIGQRKRRGALQRRPNYRSLSLIAARDSSFFRSPLPSPNPHQKKTKNKKNSLGARRPPRRGPQGPQLQAPRAHRHQDRHPARGQEDGFGEGPRRQRGLREVRGVGVGTEAGAQGGESRSDRPGEVQGVGEEVREGQGDQGEARMKRGNLGELKRGGEVRERRELSPLSFFAPSLALLFSFYPRFCLFAP